MKRKVMVKSPPSKFGFARSRTSTSGTVPADKSFPVVGIGASAGGLEAFTELLNHLPVDTGMSFVLVQHLDPVHESALTKILTKATSMPVRDVTNNLTVEANHVYVIPPNTTLSIAQGVLKLKPRKQVRTATRSIDSFLESLAQDQRERAIGVILSGTASDGTVGLEAIKTEGGITFAQDDSAKYDSMPRSAVAAGCVDFVLSPTAIAKELARIARHPYVARPSLKLSSPEEDRADATAHRDDETPLPSGGHGTLRTGAKRARAEAEEIRGKAGDSGYKKILLLLRNHSGVDFSLYKSNTIQRRITRRVVLNTQDSLDDYADFLRGNTKELDALYSDALISVTSFFRNPEAFEVLKRKVFPTLLQQRGDEPFRVWVLGCSTGQEAYSLAMAFMEAADKAPRLRKLQVFATDLNEALLEKARHGLYAKSLAEDISPTRLRRFFVEEEGGYRIVKSLREMVVFARQNLITDPPFSRMDLISCRNLLIYLEPTLQKKALPTFHYALKPHGFLFLGASESIGGFTDLFEPIDKKQKIYAKKAATQAFHLPVKSERVERNLPRHARSPVAEISRDEPPQGLPGELSAQREADRMTVNRFAPPGVLISADMQILQFRGPTSAYLQPPTTGKATFDVLKMAREGLMLPLRSTINKAKKENRTARRENVRMDQNGNVRTVNIEVVPLKNLRERCYLILFEEAQGSETRVASQAGESILKTNRRGGKNEEASRSQDLERELAETRDYLQSIQEQHEAANEELQASNEEVQSANEELQSINEELETSKEELESTNEELTTVNEEMANRNAELSRLNSDLTNLQTSTKLAIVLLGRDLTIRRFSAQAEKQFNLMARDVGRPITNVRLNLDLPDLEEFIGDVISNVRESEREVRDADGRWYSLQVRPYISLDNKVDGAVVVMVDISALKQNEAEIKEARDYAEAIIETVREPLLVLDEKLRVQTANRAFYDEFQVSPEETQNRLLYELGNYQWDIPKLRTLLQEILPNNHTFHDFEVEREFENIGHRTMLLNARRLEQHGKQAPLILLAIEDITDRKRAEKSLRQSKAQLAVELAGAQQLQETSTLLIHGGDIGTLFQKILDTAIATMHADMGSLQMFYPDRGELQLLAWKGFDAASAALWEWVRPVGGSTCAVALSTGQRVVAVDVKACDFMAGTKDLDAYRKSGIRSVQSTPLVSRSGKIVGMISTHWRQPHQPEGRELRFLDVLARQAADLIERAQMEQARVRLASIVEFSDDAIISQDLDGIITSWNKGAERLFGYTPREAMGHPVTMLIPPERLDEEPRISARVRQGESIEHYETVRCRKDGTPVDISLTVSPIKNEQGQIVGASKIARDICERKRAEEERELLLNREREARLEADKANTVKDEFLATVSHELRTPLNAILGWAEMLVRGVLDEKDVVRGLKTIARNARAQDQLISDLLDVSRIISGQLRFDRTAVELNPVIRAAADTVRPMAEAKGVALQLLPDPTAVMVSGDAARLQQIVANLLMNAVKFTPEKGRIDVRLERQDMNVVITVRDTGEGISPEFLPYVFDRFRQAEGKITRRQGGLGLGLAIVRHLVELHGGTVLAASPGLGQGASFTVTFPSMLVSKESDDVDRTQAPGRSACDGSCLNLKGVRVLVVDDEADVRDLLTIALTRRGAEVKASNTAREALEVFDHWKPDLLVSDIGMPREDGYKLIRKVRALETECGGTIPAVALTGYASDEDAARARAAGYHLHIPKPVSPSTLIETLASLVIKA